MKKFFVLFLTVFLLLNRKIFAEENIAESSASILKINLQKSMDELEIRRKIVKKETIKKILEDYHSPLSSKADFFIKVCFKYEIDCYLLPSIAGVESTFGKYIYPESYNPFGWGGGYIIFSSWEEAIETVALKLKTNYINLGYDTIEKIAPIYAQGSSWDKKVNYFKSLFEKEEKKNQLLLIKNQLEL